MKYTPIKVVQLVRESRINAERPTASGSEAAKTIAMDFFNQTMPAQEVFCVMCLDTKRNVTNIVPVTKGTLDASLVHPREVFIPALLSNASAIVIAHNHPSGNPQPSSQDWAVLRRLEEVGETLGIPVLDSIIVGEFALSMREVSN